ncbi:type I-E CRISPR-associated protein Cas6/Cse3/CasE [Tessaracoccus sp. OH4464_COT-324]|uniref:type I-E CRISPR-associated protein Cas6/Cse3/CasE n=1 Tax=Tessaracoccus sp. OH4464_COT-324 TaxID=2491059 RepID=UPI000F6419F2|nr:type I-E CRISPR-associated protein Cas6/Cse3/CasE [Tessaracoccus sp. OH4464_COT-324]RRD45916.1 type I-E CRISPR-associated protein Cas6/Cse3/CasE [Tessaracoccus sp. OH4464_COT-324]
MILTRTLLNIRRPGARKLLGSPQAMHAAVEAGFPTSPTTGRSLWRVDLDDPVRPTLYVLSPTSPDFTHIEEQAGWPSQPTTDSLPYSPLLDSLKPGQVWAFRVKVNPTHRVKLDGKSKILAHKTAQHQMRWLLERQEALGVSLGSESEPSFRLSRRETIRFRRGGMQVTLGTALFDGLLEIRDPGKFRSSLLEGIGRAKGYGCGLLTLAKP